jgi:hypothetical protein
MTILRCLWIMPLLVAVAAAQTDTTPRIRESPAKGRVSEDPLVNPSSSKPHPQLPVAAVARSGTDTEEEEKEETKSGWAIATWSRSTLRLTGTAQKNLSLASPSTLLIKATWPGKADVTINVIKDGNKLASAKSVKNFDGQRLATACVKVPSGGNVLIRAKGSGNQPLDLELYIGVLKTSR